MQARSGGALQHPTRALPIRLTPFISAEDKADHLEVCTALLPPPEVAELVAQQGAVAAAEVPVAQQGAVAAAEQEPVAQQGAVVVAAAAKPAARSGV